MEAEKGNIGKMRTLLRGKKLFSIPWLLVGDIILINYPDKYDAPGYRESIVRNKISQKARKLEKIFGQNVVQRPSTSFLQILNNIYGDFVN